MLRNRFLQITLIALAAAVPQIPAYGQTSTPTPKPTPDDEVIKVNSRLVVVPVSVTDASGQAILGLTAQDFRLAEENRPQTIDHVGSADVVPLEIALLFDVSASTDRMFKFEQETAAKFLLDVMRGNDRATVYTVGERGVLVQSRDTAEKSIQTIRSIVPTKEYTAFYDSVRMAAEQLNKNSPDGVRKVIVIISDGDDTWSEGVQKAIKAAERKISDNVQGKDLYLQLVKARDGAKSAEQAKVVRALQDADTVFYSINPGGNSYQLSKEAVFGQQNMERFATETGGTAFLPKLVPIDTKDTYQNENNVRQNQDLLTRIFRQLANELRSQYLIQYYSESEFPLNKFVKLDVGLSKRPELRIRARQGYYVKK